MENRKDQEGLIRRYLLGLLEQDEQRQLEERLLSDTEYFEELLVAEDELVDEYIEGALSEGEREKFEHYFLATPERQRKLSFARALKNHITFVGVTEPSPASDKKRGLVFWDRLTPAALFPKKPIRGFSLAAVLIIVLGISWLIVKELGLQNRAGQGSNAIAVSLAPGRLRGTGETKRVVIAPDVSTVRLQLELAADQYQSYQAVVQTDEGSEVFASDKLKPEAAESERIVAFDLPASLLRSGDFQVKLRGLSDGGNLEDVGNYYFRVARVASQPQ
jgi:hypothetical protein